MTVLVTRPIKKTKARIKKLEHAFALDCSVDEACFYADITKQTYYNWIKSYPELKERLDALRNRPVLLARQSVVNSFRTKPEIALKYLERKVKHEFSPGLELSGRDGKDLPTPILCSQPLQPSEKSKNLPKESESSKEDLPPGKQ